MANIYPPILDSQRSSIASQALTSDFSIPFTMPSSTEPLEIGHVQVLIQRQSNLDSWSTKNLTAYSSGATPPYVPEKTTIYLPVIMSEGEYLYTDSKGSLKHLGDTAWSVSVPIACIRGLYSTSNSDVGDPGFPAGDEEEGETFTIQIRFGTEYPTYQDGSTTFASWNSNCVASRNYGEWSNTQKMFVYSLNGASDISELFEINVNDDPILGLSWAYSPVSEDGLIQARVTYAWTTPGETYTSWTNNYKAVDMAISGSTGNSAGAAGVADLGMIRLVGVTLTIEFLTINNTSYTYKEDITVYPFVEGSGGTLTEMPLAGEEIEDGCIYMSAAWQWPSTDTEIDYYRIYRVDTETLEVVLLKTVYFSTADAVETCLFKDYAVEMGAGYVYFPIAYDFKGNADHVLKWDTCLNADSSTWSPTSFDGYSENMNFEGNSFLTTKTQQLRLQGNVTVSSFKRNTSDQLTTTIGSAYPFFSRASAQNYRSFSLQALIGIDFDPTNCFLSFREDGDSAAREALVNAADEEYSQTRTEALANYGYGTVEYIAAMDAAYEKWTARVTQIYAGVNPFTGLSYLSGSRPSWSTGQLYYSDGSSIDELIIKNSKWFSQETFTKNKVRRVDSTSGGATIESVDTNGFPSSIQRGAASIFSPNKSYDSADIRHRDDRSAKIFAERKFRDAVMTWASNGKPKLYRSETEGNMIVMVTGASFAPFTKSRHQYTFSATITEIAEFNLANLIKYDLIPTTFTSFYLPDYSDLYAEAEADDALEEGYIFTEEDVNEGSDMYQVGYPS